MAIGQDRRNLAKGVDGLGVCDRVLNKNGIMPKHLILYHGGRDGCCSSFRGPLGEVVHPAQVLVAGRVGHDAGLRADYSAQAA